MNNITLTVFLFALSWSIRHIKFRIRNSIEKGLSISTKDLSIYEIAYLSGGINRAVDLAIVELVREKVLFPFTSDRKLHTNGKIDKYEFHISENNSFTLTSNPQKSSDYSIHSWRKKIKPSMERVKCSLYDKKLHISKEEEMFWKFIRLPLGFSGFLLMETINFGWLPLIAFSCSSIACSIPASKRTQDLLNELRKEYSSDVSLNFALTGPSSLYGGAMDNLMTIMLDRKNSSEGACGCGC